MKIENGNKYFDNVRYINYFDRLLSYTDRPAILVRCFASNAQIMKVGNGNQYFDYAHNMHAFYMCS